MSSLSNVSTSLATEGPCLRATLDNLREGHGAKPMSEGALAKARTQAIAFLEKVVRSFGSDVAAGEVGAKGSARASTAAPIAGSCPTGLLYGRVQSGKTLAMITFTALALDNGFRVVVVLTSNYIKLVEQTATRFSALQGPLLRKSTALDSWDADAPHVQQELGEHGIVFICGKDPQHLATLVRYLVDIGATDFPALILDDEADQATPDTTTNARASNKPTAPKFASTINRRTVQNDADWELGESVREKLRHNVFIQVTATPYALFLQNSDNPLRPKLAHLLEPGDGYTGGEVFFAEQQITDGPAPPLVYVPEQEFEEIDQGATEAPIGLAQAISFFLLSASAQFLLARGSASHGQNFLCHTSPKTTDHERLATLIRGFLAKVGTILKDGNAQGEVAIRLHWAYDELRRTLTNVPPLDDLLASLKQRLPRRQVHTVNSATQNVEFGREINFLVGGNILGRGLTIDNLLVTYYLRRAKITQMDTMLQHARMFGYRGSLMPYTRVFLPELLAVRFHEIHKNEQALRSLIGDDDARSRVPVQIAKDLRATRTNVLDTGSVSAYTPAQQIYPGDITDAPAATAKKIDDVLKAAFGGPPRNGEFVDTSIDTLIKLVELVPYPERDPGSWDPRMIITVLRSIRKRYSERGSIMYRKLTAAKHTFSTGAAHGKTEVKGAKERGIPVLMLFPHATRTAWFPTIMFPEDMPVMLFNITA